MSTTTRVDTTFNSALYVGAELARELADRIAAAPTADEQNVSWKQVRTLVALVETLARLVEKVDGCLRGEPQDDLYA